MVFCKAVFKSDKLLKSHQKYLLTNSYLKAAVDKFVFFARPLSKAKPHEKKLSKYKSLINFEKKYISRA